MRVAFVKAATCVVAALTLGCAGRNEGAGGAAGQGGGSAGAGAAGVAGSGGTPTGAAGMGASTGVGGSTGGSGNGGSDSDAAADHNDAQPSADTRDGSSSEVSADDVAPDGRTPYNPCPPAGTPCAIMPVGDSITLGSPNPAAGGYRAVLFHLAHSNAKSITFVGSLADGPATVDGVPFPRSHEGHTGYNIDATQGRSGVSPFFPDAITTNKPNIVLLMIGTNDVDTGETDIPTRLGALMDKILNADPKLLLVVAQIVPQQKATPDTANAMVQAFNAAVPGLVKTRADAAKHVVMVDMFTAFTSNPSYSTAYLANKLHPSVAGFVVMANTWYAAIGPLLH